MKNLLLLVFCLLCVACAKKTYTLNSKTAEEQFASAKDSMSSEHTVAIDKTITITQRIMDTTLLVSESSLTGYLNLQGEKGDTSTYVENADLRLLLSIQNGRLTATATAKPQKIHANYVETKSVFTNTNKNTDTKTALKNTVQFKNTSEIKQSEKKIYGLSSLSFILPILLMLSAVVFLFRKFNLAGKLIK